ncbi:MAG: hypothetical protein CHACPFDD_01031 [Phycisphaerae bacterium]|nr:hypothetical protein [Phycisphaerae bacterium]
MKVLIQHRAGSIGTALRELIHRRVQFALGRFAHRIAAVRVRIDDVNGPRGGPDRRCLVEATPRPHGTPIVAEVIDESAEAAVGRAAERVARQLRGRIERSREMRRGRASQPLALPPAESRHGA